MDKKKILHAGAGENSTIAEQPIIYPCQDLTLGLVAYCDHQDDFAAQENRPGMAYLNINNLDYALEKISASLLDMLTRKVNWPILSLHWGPNMTNRPSNKFVYFAHAAIDMGYKMIFGHSAHVFHGVEIYRGCPIIYAAGDLVDDYYVDPEFKNDHQLLFEIVLKKNKLQKIFLYPIFIQFCRTDLANNEQFNYIFKRAKTLCDELGTKLEIYDKGRLIIQ